MSIEKNIGLLAEATTGLLEAVNVRESTLDAKVQDAEASALQAASKVPLAEAEKAAAEAAALQAETYKDATLTSLNIVKTDINYLELEAIAQTKSVSAVDVFVYDTSKDSDGGAWRKRTRKTSWYKEELNTATRGSRREFPSVAVIVAEAFKVTIYDGDDPSMPMWAVYSPASGAEFGKDFWYSTLASSISAKNGSVYIALQSGSSARTGLAFISFLADKVGRYAASSVNGGYGFDASSGPKTQTLPTRFSVSLVNNRVNDIALTVLPDAPIDPATGLPIPTIAVATAGGVSVIKDDGTVVDITGSDTSPFTKVVFLPDNKILFTLWNGYNSLVYEIPDEDILGISNSSTGNALEGYHSYYYTNPDLQLTDTYYSRVEAVAGMNKDIAYGMRLVTGVDHSLVLLNRNIPNPAKGMLSYITSTYNTGWMHGDIKMAALSDTDSTELVAESDELITNGADWTGASESTAPTAWREADSGNMTFDTSDGRLKMISGDVYQKIAQRITTEAGKTYILSLDVDKGTGLPQVKVGTAANAINIYANLSLQTGTYAVLFTAINENTYITIQNNPDASYVYFDNVSVKEVQGVPAQQPVSTQRPTYNATTKSLELDLVDDSLVYNVPTGGIDGYMVIGTNQGTASYGVSLPEGPYEIGGDYFPGNEIHGFLLREGDSTASELDTVEDYFVEQGAKASYGDVTSFSSYWRYKGITEFPLIDTSSGTNFSFAWRNNNLTSFPLIDTSSGTTFSYAWFNNNLTSFPLIDTSSGVSFTSTWQENNLTSFPLIDTSSGISFQYAWFNNTALSDFPANMFDNCLCTNFTGAFLSTGLTQTSIDGILVSIESNGTSNGTFGQSGGSAPSATGEAAINALVTRGWTVSVTGGYQGKVLPEGLFENDENGFWYSMDIGE